MRPILARFPLLLALLLALPVTGARAAAPTTSHPVKHRAAKAKSARHRAEREREREAAGEDTDRKYLPPDDGSRSDTPEGHASWRWHLLTYPKDTVPAGAFTRAKAWVENNVPAGTPWPNADEGLPRTGPLPMTIAPVPTGNWTLLGPKPIDMGTQTSGYRYGHVTGRFNAIAVDPRTAGNAGAITAYATSPSGGFWKTTNCCTTSTTWTSLLDTAPVQAFTAVELDPNDPDVVYVGTGDADAADQFSEGLFKSTDGGSTWTQYGADVFVPFAAGSPHYMNQNTGWIKVDPHDSNTVLAGTRFSLFVSHDAGQNWTRCPFGANEQDPLQPLPSPMTAALNRITSIVLDPGTTPTTAYVAVGYGSTSANGDNGVYKGTIAASGCPALVLKNNGWPANTGNGTNGATSVGNIRLAASRGNMAGTFVLYAQVANLSGNNALGTYVSLDGGESWTMIPGSGDSGYTNCNGPTGEGQDWYDLFLLADPQNDKVLYVGRTDMYRMTLDANYANPVIVSLANVYAPGCAGYGKLHPDQHGATWVSGTGATTQFLLGNDGGVYLANGDVGGFTSLNDTINATQWYAGQIGASFASASTQLLFAGAQDNGTASWDSSNAAQTWQARANGGDGFFSAFDPIAGTLTAGTWLSEYVNGSLYRSTAGARGSFSSVASQPWASDNPAWSTPYRFDVFHCKTTNCNNMILGARHLYASVTAGSTWTKAGSAQLSGSSANIIALDVAPANPSAVVVGTSDGNVQVSMNVFSGTSCTKALANTSTFTCTVNGGATWTNVEPSHAVLPNRAINGVTFDPNTANTLYAAVGGFDENTPGTPGHVFVATLSGSTWTWTDKTGNLPDVPAESIVINPSNPNQAFLGTDYGFYATDNIAANPPKWYRYQLGLPTTIVKYLALDRGPSTSPYASTTIAAFTYGRGAYAIRIPGTTGFPPHPVPPTVRATRNGGRVDVAFDTSCSSPDTNAYWGALGAFSNVTGAACSLGTSGQATIDPPANSWFVLTGADNGSGASGTISSFGTDSSGRQETFGGWAGRCAANAQNTTLTCP